MSSNPYQPPEQSGQDTNFQPIVNQPLSEPMQQPIEQNPYEQGTPTQVPQQDQPTYGQPSPYPQPPQQGQPTYGQPSPYSQPSQQGQPTYGHPSPYSQPTQQGQPTYPQPYSYYGYPRPKKSIFSKVMIVLVSLFGMLVVLALIGYFMGDPDGVSNVQDIAVGSGTTNGESTAADIFARYTAAVFRIELFDITNRLMGTGSGFFISSGGVAVTNHHVMAGAHSATITTYDGRVLNISGFYSFDAGNDLAIIQVEGSNFTYVNLGNSDMVSVGDIVYALGSPEGDVNTFTSGMVSSMPTMTHFNIYSVPNMIQHTAAIYGGSSGGALFNTAGQVIGINAAGDRNRPSVQFAVRSNVIDIASAGGNLLSLPIQAGQDVTTAFQIGHIARYTGVNIPDIDSVVRGARFIMGGHALDMGMDNFYSWGYTHVFRYEMSYRDFMDDMLDYEDMLSNFGFFWQNEIERDDGVWLVYYFNPTANMSFFYAFIEELEILDLGIGPGNLYEQFYGYDPWADGGGRVTWDDVHASSFPLLFHNPDVPDLRDALPELLFNRWGYADDLGLGGYRIGGQQYIWGFDFVAVYNVPGMDEDILIDGLLDFIELLYDNGFADWGEGFYDYEHLGYFVILLWHTATDTGLQLIWNFDNDLIYVAVG